MAELNLEAQVMCQDIPWRPRLLKNNRLLVSLEEAIENEETSEWVGFVKTMKIFLNKKFRVSYERLEAKIEERMDRLEAKMEAKMEAGQAKIEAGQAKMESYLEAIVIELIGKK